MDVDLSKWMDASLFWTEILHDVNINTSAMQLLWRKAYNCPCAAWSNGQPDRACQSCFGLGYGYEASTGPYSGFIGFNYPAEGGMTMDLKQGGIETGNPYLLIAGNETPIYSDFSAYDMIIEDNSTTTYHAALYVGTQETLPFAYNASVPAASAVRIYDPVNHVSKFIDYTVNGNTVTISGYPEGTGYTVTYTANQAYIAHKEGAYPHSRPFNGDFKMPRRWQLQRLDLWMRQIPIG